MSGRQHRVISGLLSAQPESSGPWAAPTGLKGAKARGIAYERRLARAIPLAIHAQWFSFCDTLNGPGWCQPDLILRGRRTMLVLEAKYTWTMAGHTQIEQLYKPVVELAWGLPVVGVVVCKCLVSGAPVDVLLARDLKEAILMARDGYRPVLHWIGVGQIGLPV